MKKLLLLGTLAAVGITTVATYPALGGYAYHLTMAAERTLYGLDKSSVDGGDIRLVTLQGGVQNAPAVIMIHGYSADKDVWIRFARHFTDRYRVIIVDLAGHGETGFDSKLKYDTTSQSSRVLHAMNQLGIERAHIIGNSMGGFIAARLAHDHPQRILSATLIDAAGVTSPRPSVMGKLLAKGENPFLFSDREGFYRFYPMTMAKAPWMPSITLDWIADQYIARQSQLARIFNDFHNVNLLDNQLADIRVPTLVMWGAKDELVSVSAADVWCQGIVGCQQVIYDDLGHMPMLEAPTRSAHDVLAFIEKQNNTAPANK
ncbi:alpha/beta fold hydrolase [Agitococcus lubricus]|uniref:Pimeloyl-ACP methyl ester carboxylesterase n=1 Tax=Agitococcus lubricus TaxID=1077255 RepID=A0A2T5IYH2_9GAMM|nr:alpha/beta hydrolase [Agitococcus lubricus]PTQ89036.1 pimeloyl-ACP methyl ester carboxylesterase [Agitococcus lubricus]